MKYHLGDATSCGAHAVDSSLPFSKRQDIEGFSVFLLLSDPLEYKPFTAYMLIYVLPGLLKKCAC